MKKGFTLIELLAVIVILAIIALIATPIVLSIIEETKESAVLRSAEFYLRGVEQSIMKKNLSAGGSFSPKVCDIQEDGNLLCDGKDILEIEVSGEKSRSGTITFEKGKIIGVDIKLSNKRIIKYENGKLVHEPSICKLINDIAPTGISAGDKYQCKVKSNMEIGWEDGYYFYVLSKETNGTTNLIMDRNIYSNGTPEIEEILESEKESNGGIYSVTPWINQGDYQTAGGSKYEDQTNYGPVTAMNFLNNATSNWNNLNNLNISYNDEGGNFTDFKVTGKSRLPYEREVSNYDGTNGYLYGYLWFGCYDDDWNYHVSCDVSNNIEGVYEEGLEHSDAWGYWTFSSDEDCLRCALYVSYDGDLYSDEVTDAGYYGAGIRPVINVNL